MEYEDLEIRLLDSELKTVARYPVDRKASRSFAWQVKAADMDGDGIDEILSLSDHVEILKFRPK